MKTITVEVTCQQSAEIQIDKLPSSEGLSDLLEDLNSAEKDNDGWVIEQGLAGQIYSEKRLISFYGPMISYDSEFCFTDTTEKDDPIWFTWEELHNSVEKENEDFVLDGDNVKEGDLISFRIHFTDEPVVIYEFEVEDDFELGEDIVDKITIQITNIRTENVEYLEAEGIDLLSGITLMEEEPDEFDITEISEQTSVHAEVRLFETPYVSDQIFEFDDYIDILKFHSNWKELVTEKLNQCKRNEQL